MAIKRPNDAFCSHVKKNWPDESKERLKSELANQHRNNLISDMAHAKKMIGTGKDVEHWQGEVERLKKELIV